MFKIKSFLHRLKEGLGLAFYTKPQNYNFSYSDSVENLSSQNNEIIVVFPTIKETDFQKIEKSAVFNPEGYGIDSDKKFKNFFVWWKVVLKPKERIEFRQNGEVKISPRKFSFSGGIFRLDDYLGFSNIGEYQLYLFSDYYLNGRDRKIKELADKISGSDQRIDAVALKFYEFVRDRLNYGEPISGLYSFKDALEKPKVDCGGFASLLGSLLMAKGIPSRIVSGFWAGHSNNRNKNPMHSWLEFMLPDGRWIPLDPSIEHLFLKGETNKFGGFGFVGSDRIVFSVGSDIVVDVEGRKITTDILQNPIIIAENGKESVKTEFIFNSSTI